MYWHENPHAGLGIYAHLTDDRCHSEHRALRMADLA